MPRPEAVAVDDNGLGADLQAVEGAVHGEDRGVKNVDVVYLPGRGVADGPAERVALDDLPQGVAPRGGERLGVGKVGVSVSAGEDDCGGIHSAGQTSAASLVAAGLVIAVVQVALQHFLHLLSSLCSGIVVLSLAA